MSLAEREKQDARRHNAKSWADKEDSLFASKVVKFPDGVKAIKLKPPTMNIDVIEYVCGPSNPECDEGLLHFELSYYIHRVPAPDGQQAYPCLWANHKKPCPICDWMREQHGRSDPQLLKDMRPNHRHLMNAVDLNSRDPLIQILDVNHYNRGAGFGEQLKSAMRAVPQFATFAQYDGGYTLVLTVTECSMGGGKKYNAATRIDFVPRARPYGPDVLKYVHNLEACLIPYEYDQLRGLFLQQGPSTTPPATQVAVSGYGQQPPQAPAGFRAPPPVETQRWSSQDPQQANVPAFRREEPTSVRQPYERAQYETPPQAPAAPAPLPPQFHTPPATVPVHVNPATIPPQYYAPPATAEQPPQAPQYTPPHHPAKTHTAPPQQPPQAPADKPRLPVASDYGMVVGDHVEHQRFGMCEIVRISPDGSLLTLEDANAMEYRAIAPHEVRKMNKTASQPQQPAPATPTAAPSPPPAPAQRETAPPPPVARFSDDEFDRRPTARPSMTPMQDPRRRDD